MGILLGPPHHSDRRTGQAAALILKPTQLLKAGTWRSGNGSARTCDAAMLRLQQAAAHAPEQKERVRAKAGDLQRLCG